MNESGNSIVDNKDPKETFCPICGSSEVYTVESNLAYEVMECCDCEYTWRV